MAHSVAQRAQANLKEMLKHLVRTTAGVCEVTLERGALDLSDRGGFEARWVQSYAESEVVELEAYRRLVKTYLDELYQKRRGQVPGNVALNLASHQLIDDLTGWTKLNWGTRSGPASS